MKRVTVSPDEHHEYYGRYIEKLAADTELLPGFETGGRQMVEFFLSIPDDKLTYRYEPGKWDIKEILQHLIDTERIFIYRCFRIARHDPIPLAGFNQDDYVAPSNATQKSLTVLIREYEAVRVASRTFLSSLSDKDLQTVGNANGSAMSARAAAFIIIGHEIWHQEVIRQRYL